MLVMGCNKYQCTGFIYYYENTIKGIPLQPMYLALCVCCQQYVPCSKVSVDETLLGEVLHSISNLLTESQQLIRQVNIFLA